MNIKRRYDKEQIRMLESFQQATIKHYKKEEQKERIKIWYHRIDEGLLQYSNVFDISFVDVCKRFNINYNDFVKMREGEYEDLIKVRENIYIKEIKEKLNNENNTRT